MTGLNGVGGGGDVNAAETRMSRESYVRRKNGTFVVVDADAGYYDMAARVFRLYVCVFVFFSRRRKTIIAGRGPRK